MEQKIRGNKDFKKGGKLGQGVGALKEKGGGGWNPLMNYDIEIKLDVSFVVNESEIPALSPGFIKVANRV